MSANDLADRPHIGADEAQRLLDAATPGEWEWRSLSGDVVRLHDDNPPTLVAALFNRADQCQAEYDAALIAAAPRLAAAVVRLSEQLDTLRNAIGDPATLRCAEHTCSCPASFEMLRAIADAACSVDALAAAGGGVPEEGATDGRS